MPKFADQHQIGRVILDLQFESEALARTWQAQAAADWASFIAPLLSELLDQYCPPGYWVGIERIELHLEGLSEATFQVDFPRQVAQALGRWLGAHPLPDPAGAAGLSGEGLTVLAAGAAGAARVAYFLAHGHLGPWLGEEELEEGLRQLLAESPEKVRALLAGLPVPAVSATRLVQRFGWGLRRQLLRRLAGAEASRLLALRQDLLAAVAEQHREGQVDWPRFVDEALFTLALARLPAPLRREEVLSALAAQLMTQPALRAQGAAVAQVLAATRQRGPRKYQRLQLPPLPSGPSKPSAAVSGSEEPPPPDLQLDAPAHEGAPLAAGVGLAKAGAGSPELGPGLITRLDHWQAWLAQGQPPWWSDSWPEAVLPGPGLAFEALWQEASEAVITRFRELLQAVARQDRRSSMPLRWEALLGPVPVQVLLPALVPALAPVWPAVRLLVEGVGKMPRLRPHLRPGAGVEAVLLAALLQPEERAASLGEVLAQGLFWWAATPADNLPVVQAAYEWSRQAAGRTPRLRPLASLLGERLRTAGSALAAPAQPGTEGADTFLSPPEVPGEGLLGVPEDPPAENLPPRAESEASPPVPPIPVDDGLTPEVPPVLPAPDLPPPPPEDIPAREEGQGEEDPPAVEEKGEEKGEDRVKEAPIGPSHPPGFRPGDPRISQEETTASAVTAAPLWDEKMEQEWLAAVSPEARQRVLHHLATHGSLPAEAQGLSQAGLGALVARWVVAAPAESGRLLGRLIRQEAARQHLGRLLPPEAFRAWVATLPALTGSDLLAYVDLLDELMPAVPVSWRQQALLAYLSRHEGRSPVPATWLDWVLRQATRLDQLTPRQRLAQWQEQLPRLRQAPEGWAALLEVLQRAVAQRPEPAPPKGPDSPGEEAAPVPEKPAARRRPLPGDVALYVPNAGIVLVWPFLPHYFQQAGLLGPARRFRDDAAAERAIHLLQYLVNKRTDTPEEALVLNKVLCGWPLAKPVVGAIEIEAAEVDLAESLIEAARQRWGPLKNASNDGFRGSFFLRDGRLSATSSENWKLVVAQKPYDMLLDQLPWSLSMIRLPWMEGLLAVEWR